MNNYVQCGKSIQVTAPTGGFTSGSVYKVGDTVGVAIADVAASEEGILSVDGVYNVAKASAVTFTQGNRVWWDDSNSEFTTTTGGNTLVGTAMADVATGVVTADVRWNSSF